MEEGRRQENVRGGGGLADELEAVRSLLRDAMRRQPGDKRAVMRMAEGLARMEAAQQRLSPRKTRDLAEKFKAVLDRVGAQILPPE